MDADTDAAFVAEANMDGERSNTRGGSPGNSLQGEQNILTAKGGLDANISLMNEETALLSPPGDNPDDDRGSGHEWSASKDFEDRPWYRRPTVCTSWPSFSRLTNLGIFSCIGCWVLSW